MKKLENLQELETGNKMLLFSTSWCGDCIMLDQYIDRVEEMFKDKWDFIYVDRDENIDLAKDFNIYGIPSFVALRDSEKVADFISKDGKSFDEVVGFINSIK